jgi:hypothetical protein
MPPRDRALILSGLCLFFFACTAQAQQAPPPPAGARILLLPRRIVSGERATLAVLDVNGRLTPGVTVNFSNGDRLTTDQSGRGLFVAPLNPGVIFGSVAGRPGRVATAIISPTDPAVSQAGRLVPRIASLSDRFDILGSGFCGDADANAVTIGGEAAIVLASSPMALVVLPPTGLDPGPATVQITCGKNTIPTFSMIFLGLELHADSSPLAPGEHRRLTVSVSGTTAKISLEAKNLAPDIAELVGGDSVRNLSSGGAENTARFEVVGRRRGSFLISIRLVPLTARPTP